MASNVVLLPPASSRSCTAPTIEATVGECVPLARAAVAKGEAEALLMRIRAAREHNELKCVFYETAGDDSKLGKCSQYEHRPSICRLFGFRCGARTRFEGIYGLGLF